MEIVKKNLISIICGVIAIAALVVALVMLPGQRNDLQAQLDRSKSTYDTANELLTKERQLPVVNPDNPEQQRMTQFPSQKVIAQGNAIVEQVQKQSKALHDAAVKMNRHEPLMPGALPNPSNREALQFRTAYQQALPMPVQPGAGIGVGINPAQGAGTPTVLNSVFAKALTAGMPPTPDEITRRQAELAEKLRRDNLLIGAGGQPVNAPQVEQMVQEQTVELPKKLMEEVSQTSRIYVSPDTFEIYPAIFVAGAPSARDIYFAHLGLWIQQDVVAAINEINAQSKSVPTSPVKYLTSIRVESQGVPLPVLAGEGGAGGDPNAELPKNHTVSPTGRVSNGLYDVFHFNLTADVQADQLPHFLRALSHRRFITPIGVNVKAVDNAAALARGHVYGDQPVVTVNARCEILYLRSWNEPLMPPVIKQWLGIGAPAGGEGAMPAGGVEEGMEQPAF